VVIVPLGEGANAAAQRLLADVRRNGIAADMAYRGNMKKRLSRANDAGASYALILGDVELESGEAQLKNLATGEQRSVAFDRIVETLRS
jgi:histidyl-tRNA synthetase